MSRHILTLGEVSTAFLDAAVNIWQADRVNQSLVASDSVLILVAQESTGPAQYVRTLQEVDAERCSVGVIPISGDSSGAYLKRLLGRDEIRIDFAKSRFRLTDCPEANLPCAPPVLRRAHQDDRSSVSRDLDVADLLVLQGHAGPVDGGFGRWLTFCSRHLYQPGKPPLFPCFGTDQCFRQALHGRAVASMDGLVDPAALRSPLVVLDGCGTLPVPGSLFRYETSIARSVMASQVRAAVMTHGVSATPLSVFVVFLAMLASGRTLGEAVREANQHGRDLMSPTSIEGAATAPWILVGNPEVKVLGIPLIETALRVNQDGLEFTLDERDIHPQTGAIVSLANAFEKDGAFDVACSDGRWARGALRRDGRAYMWVSGQRAHREYNAPTRVAVALSQRSPDPTSNWCHRSKWLQANRLLLDRMATVVTERSGNPDALRSLISLWADVGGAIEHVAFAAAPHRRQAIAPSLATWTGQLIDVIERLDRLAAATVAAAVPDAGARLYRLWSPPWFCRGPAQITELCSCGCPIAGDVLHHPVLDLARINLRCPACGPLGDVSARGNLDTLGSARFEPTVLGVPGGRCLVRDRAVLWPVRRLFDDQVTGFACAALFDPFRQRRVVTDAIAIPPRGRVDVPVAVPADWPEGLSQAVIVVTAGGEMSFLDFDVVVRAGN